MGRLLDEEEFGRWVRSAEATYSSAVRDLRDGDYGWACFKAHQAAEKALKALIWGTGNPTYGHSLKKLYEHASKIVGGDEEVLENAMRLDKYYTATRYPDVWESGIPEEYFSKGEAEEAVARSRKIIEWVKSKWRSLSRGSG